MTVIERLNDENGLLKQRAKELRDFNLALIWLCLFFAVMLTIRYY